MQISLTLLTALSSFFYTRLAKVPSTWHKHQGPPPHHVPEKRWAHLEWANRFVATDPKQLVPFLRQSIFIPSQFTPIFQTSLVKSSVPHLTISLFYGILLVPVLCYLSWGPRKTKACVNAILNANALQGSEDPGKWAWKGQGKRKYKMTPHSAVYFFTNGQRHSQSLTQVGPLSFKEYNLFLVVLISQNSDWSTQYILITPRSLLNSELDMVWFDFLKIFILRPGENFEQ